MPVSIIWFDNSPMLNKKWTEIRYGQTQVIFKLFLSSDNGPYLGKKIPLHCNTTCYKIVTSKVHNSDWHPNKSSLTKLLQNLSKIIFTVMLKLFSYFHPQRNIMQNWTENGNVHLRHVQSPQGRLVVMAFQLDLPFFLIKLYLVQLFILFTRPWMIWNYCQGFCAL